MDRLHANGVARTTLEDVARAAGLCDTDVRALFGDMEGLMCELVSPLLHRVRDAAGSAAAADLRHAGQLRSMVGA